MNDTIRYDAIRYDTTRCDAMRCDAIRYDTTRYDTIRHGTARYDTILYCPLGKISHGLKCFHRSCLFIFFTWILMGVVCFTHYCNAHMHTHTETVFKSYICASIHLCHPGPFSVTAELFLFLAYQRDNIPDFKHTATSCKLPLQECLSLF